MSETDRQKLMNYISDVAKRVQRLRGMPPVSPHSTPPASVRPPSRPAAQKVVPPTKMDSGSDYLDFLDLPSHDLPTGEKKAAVASPPAPSPPPPKSNEADLLNMPPVPNDFLAAPDLDKPSAAPKQPSRSKEPLGPPPAMSTNHNINEYFAPRASGLVLKAIEVAIKLYKQGELKRAVDVLQHAYKTGRQERNNPANFKEIEETLTVMRKNYYQKFPPRFLQDNPILPNEMEVLRRSGITSTLLLPMWDDLTEGYGAENVFMPSEGVWEDQFTPILGDTQKRKGAQLIHIGQLERGGVPFTIIKQADPLNIKQTVVGDCTFVCSLIICASYQKRYPNAKIISNVIYPQDSDRNPIVNPKGKYCVKMLINGMTRVVTIDDRLPANPRTKELLCTYSRDPSELWVSLLEKAFVKICGGSYNFPGSSSSTDLYKLSGWLPDSLNLEDLEFDSEYEWNRISRNFGKGAVLLTISTGQNNKLESVLLSSGHCYAVTDLKTVNGRRVLVVQNPWSRPSWSGDLSHKDQSAEAKVIQEACGVTPELTDRGVFCISWEDVLKYYDRCFLSWNPYLLFPTPEGTSVRPTRIACHGVYNYSTSVGDMPQLHIGVVKAPKRTRMHLVFSRHIADVQEFGLQYDKDDETMPYVAIKVFDVSEYPSIAQNIGGKCVFGMCYCRRMASASDFTNRTPPLNSVTYRKNSAWTTSFDCPAGTTNLLAVVTRLKSSKTEAFSYTVTLHSELEQLQLSIDKPAPVDPASMESTNRGNGNRSAGVFMHAVPKTCLRHTTTVSGEWKKGKTCGGRSDVNTFIYNPQYLLSLPKPAMVSVRLCVPSCEESCQVHLVSKKMGKADSSAVTFRHRVGNTTNECSLVMRPRVYSYGGALVDSALPHTLEFDGNRVLGERQTDDTKKGRVELLSSDAKRTATFTVYGIEDSDEVSVILLQAVKNGHLVSPSLSRVMVESVNLLQGTAGWARPLGRRSASGDPLIAPGKNAFDVRISLGTEKITFAPKSAGADLWESTKKLCGDIRSCSSQLSSYVPQIISLHRRAKALPQEQASYLTDVCMFLADYVKRVADEVRPPPLPVRCLPPLPAGEYTIIPSLWEKGVPAAYELVVETTESHTINPHPR
ncbi:calpain-like protein [Angomonas deanei]|uniref:Calpain family cysteine protease/Calpain large subunit, domain III, putative n=1 Tax=Angomonas deanei TaxID=59799 RepID=A0A7G2CFM0_9TRYP|nr:calpain-like protein [Angomonas deanei]CAD2216952.1 Calpain family cysteine protease/Calpain large subunit, domain III, putative [Angomonas deanei]|eukprot:EPY41780.1 calpain-like protein [Angomonas deanei]